VKAEVAPYPTFTTSVNNDLIYTQTAYLPNGFIESDVLLSGASDLFLKNNLFYIADTDNKRVVVLDQLGNLIKEINGFSKPTGLFVDRKNNLYVCDYDYNKVFKYDDQYNLVFEYERPTEPIFGQASLFRPLKVLVDLRGNVFILGEGSTSGLIELSATGEFLGFFGANYSDNSIFQKIIKLFNVTLASNLPPSSTNIADDPKGSIYTVNPKDGLLKKFNIASVDTLNYNFSLGEGVLPVSVYVSSLLDIYVLFNDGTIVEHDSNGRPFFIFNIYDYLGTKRIGLAANPVDLVVDEKNNIYVLDAKGTKILTYIESEFAGLVHEGLAKTIDGIYDKETWTKILKLNSSFVLANLSMGKIFYSEKNYSDALVYYQRAEDRALYSEAYSEIRYQFIQSYFVPILIVFIVILVSIKVLKTVDNKTTVFTNYKEKRKIFLNKKLPKELIYSFNLIKHPIDTFIDLKQIKSSSVLTATILYILVFISLSLKNILSSFMFNNVTIENYNLFNELIIYVALVFLFIISNFLISSINDGEGSLKDIYIGFAYALFPIILLSIPITILTYVFTLNESFVISFLNFFMIAYSVILSIFMIKETHDYTTSNLVKNVILTIFTGLIIILVVFIIYLLTNQMIDFFETIIKEVLKRA
jgi:hypothetical protein